MSRLNFELEKFWKISGYDIGAAAGEGSLYAGAAGAGLATGANAVLLGAAAGAAAGVSAGFITGAGNAWMNGASFKQGLKQGGIGAAFGLGMGAVGGAAGGWFSTTPAGQKVGSWMGKHSKGRFFDRKNPNSRFNSKNSKSPFFEKNRNRLSPKHNFSLPEGDVIIDDYTMEFPAFDDGVNHVDALTVTVEVPDIPHPTILQSGGHTLHNSTLNSLNLSREQGRIAIEALKRLENLPHNFHGVIMSNGDFLHPQTRQWLGNLFDFLP